jgi:hypothetical protein
MQQKFFRPGVIIWDAFIRFLSERTILVLMIMFTMGVGGLLWHISRLQSKLVDTAALQGTALYTQAITEFRTLYTSEVVVRAQTHGVQATHDYATLKGGNPTSRDLEHSVRQPHR